MLNPKLAFMASLGYAQLPAADVLASLKKLGYHGVEWTMSHFDPRTKSHRELRQLVEQTRDAGLEVSEVCVQQDLITLDDAARQDRIALELECIEAAAAADVQVLNFFTGPAPWNPKAPKIPGDISEGAAWDMVFDAFDRLVPAAEKAGVHIAVEGVWGMLCHDYYTTRPLIRHYDSPNLGVNFDPSHDILVDNLDSGWIARRWGSDIKHMHLKDAVGVAEPGKFLFPLLGEGRVDWKGLFAALDEIGYDGFMSVEFESFTYYNTVLRGDVEEAARLSKMQISRLLEL